MSNSTPGGSGDPHAMTQRLMPWLLSGTLPARERALAEAHLAGCAQCRADLAWERSLRGACSECAPGLDPDAALGRLLPKLAPGERPPGIRARWLGRLAANDGAWLRPVAVAQLAVIALLAGLLFRPAGDAQLYRGLGQAQQAQARLVVMFAPSTPEAELRRILQANQARIVDGPTATAGYVLGVPDGAVRTVLANLRAERAVTMAQPLSLEGGQ
jgi:anti-sigma factor RsiW